MTLSLLGVAFATHPFFFIIVAVILTLAAYYAIRTISFFVFMFIVFVVSFLFAMVKSVFNSIASNL